MNNIILKKLKPAFELSLIVIILVLNFNQFFPKNNIFLQLAYWLAILIMAVLLHKISKSFENKFWPIKTKNIILLIAVFVSLLILFMLFAK